MVTIRDFNSFWGFLGHPVNNEEYIIFCFFVNLIHACMKSVGFIIFCTFLIPMGIQFALF